MVEVRVDGSERDGGHDVYECPCPGVVPEWEDDGWVAEHFERLEEVCCVEMAAGDHVAFEVE